MADPIAPLPSIRERKPFTVTVGLGMPELLHADVSYTFADQFTASAGVSANLGGTALRTAGLWHALRSPTHGHSLFVGPQLTVYPGGPTFGGNHATVVPSAVTGWEWRSQPGFTTRVSAGAGTEINGATGSLTPALSLSVDLGWSF